MHDLKDLEDISNKTNTEHRTQNAENRSKNILQPKLETLKSMLYDLSTLRKLSDNDETFIIDMLQTYKRTTPPALERMQEYLAQQKTEAIGREAHKMIPGVSFLGAKQLQDVLVKIEETAKSGEEIENMPELVAEAIRQSNELIVCFENDFPGKI